MLGNIQPALQRSVREQMNGTRLVGGDTMNYWINDFRDELLETLKGWDFLLINDSEARLLSGESNLKRAARKILEMGPSTLVIKRGEYGAMLFREDQYFIVPGYLLEEVFDPTGAGDCFAGGFVGALGGVRFRSEGSQHRPEGTGARCDLRVRHGQLLLREVRRGPIPHSDAGGDRCALPRVQDASRTSKPADRQRQPRSERHLGVRRDCGFTAGHWCARGDVAPLARLPAVLRRRRIASGHGPANHR